MFQKEVSINVAQTTTGVLIPSQIIIDGEKLKLSEGKGTFSIVAVAVDAEGNRISTSTNLTESFQIEPNLTSSVNYVFGGEFKNISIPEVISVMGAICEKVWCGEIV